MQGATRMVNDGLFTRFPKPDFVIGIHVSNTMPAGHVGVIAGPASAASDSVDITFHGKGGHGAMPHRTVDPLVIAARAVGALQTIVSREVDPFDAAAVVTVGTFHAGTKRNVIADEAKLQLTVRSVQTRKCRKKILGSIERIAKGEAAAGGSPSEPTVAVVAAESSEVVMNDPAYGRAAHGCAAADAWRERGVRRVAVHDFGKPCVQGRRGRRRFSFGSGPVKPKVFADAKQAGRTLLLPGPHSPRFAPDPERTIRTGEAVFTLSVLELMGTADE